MRFWDSSAVAALCVEESRTPAGETLVREDPELVTFNERLAEAVRLEGLMILPAT